MTANLFLLADAGDWISFLIPVVVGIIWVLNQVFGQLAKPNANKPRAEVRRPNPPPQRPQRPQPSANVNDEIEAFLRRATQRAGGEQRPQQPTVAQAAPPPPRTLAPRPEVFGDSMQRRSDDVLVEVEMVDDELAQKQRVDLSQRHLETRPFERTSKVDNADENMAEHMQDLFGHRVGTLPAAAVKQPPLQQEAAASSAPVVKPSTPSAAAGIAALLRDPRSARHAIVLQEILTRPEIRW